MKVLLGSCLDYKFSKLFYFVFILCEQSHSFFIIYCSFLTPQKIPQADNSMKILSIGVASIFFFFYGTVTLFELILTYVCLR